MKIILLAAAAVIASPLAAQTSGSTGTSSPTSNGGEGTAATPMQTAPTDQSMPAQDPSMQPAPADGTMAAPTDPSMASPQPMAPMGSTMTPEAAATAGGYQPSMPAMQGTAGAGAPVMFRAAPSPTEAFPPPAPKASYPICKKGQYDGCMQRGGR